MLKPNRVKKYRRPSHELREIVTWSIQQVFQRGRYSLDDIRPLTDVFMAAIREVLDLTVERDTDDRSIPECRTTTILPVMRAVFTPTVWAAVEDHLRDPSCMPIDEVVRRIVTVMAIDRHLDERVEHLEKMLGLSQGVDDGKPESDGLHPSDPLGIPDPENNKRDVFDADRYYDPSVTAVLHQRPVEDTDGNIHHGRDFTVD